MGVRAVHTMQHGFAVVIHSVFKILMGVFLGVLSDLCGGRASKLSNSLPEFALSKVQPI